MTERAETGHPWLQVKLSISDLMSVFRPDADTAESSPVAEDKRTYDPVEFDAVYRDTAALVMRVLRRLVPEELVEDTFQEVFIVVARKLGSFDHQAKASTWVYGIVLRVASDQRRAYRRRERRERAFAGEPEGRSQPQPDHDLSVQQAKRLLHRILEQMDDDLREVFVLADVEQVQGPTIAEILSLPLNTVHSRLRRARASFEAIRARLVSP